MCLYRWFLIALISFLIVWLLYKPIHAAADVYYDIPLEEDTYIMQNFPSISPWNDSYLFSGTDELYGKGMTRAFFKASYYSLRGQQVKAADIILAELHITSLAYNDALPTIELSVAPAYPNWDMYSLRWNSQGSYVARDTPIIGTFAGKKMINITNSLKESYSTFEQTSINRGLSLRVTQEYLPAMQFLASDCLSNGNCIADQKPYVRVFLKLNKVPSTCILSSPTDNSYRNGPNIILKASPSIDPDRDTLTYSGRICTTSDCSNGALWEGNISTTSNTTVAVPDGKYYASCIAKDGFGGAAQGNSNVVIVDTIPPAAPTIIPLDPYTGIATTTISWLPLQQNNEQEAVQYQVLASERSSFSAYNTYGEWIAMTSYSFPLAKEKTFYFKVRAKDTAGNIGEWSNSTQTTLDLTLPTISYFKSSRALVSPQKSSSPNQIENTAYIQGSITDVNISSIEIFIVNSTGERVFSQSSSEKSYLWIHWPDNLNYPDGIYTVQLQGKDFLDRTITSSPLTIEIDTKPPAKAQIVGLSNGGAYKDSKHSLRLQCEKNDIGTFYLSGRILSKDQQSFETTLKQNDGEYTIEANCIDKAGNQSSTAIKYRIDTTPPSKPSLTLTFNKLNNSVNGKIYCREPGGVEIAKYGRILVKTNCSQDQTIEKELENGVLVPTLQSYTARISDSLGNWSDLDEKSIYLESDTVKTALETGKDKVFCRVAFNISTNQFKREECLWPKEFSPLYQQTILVEPSKYRSTFIAAPTIEGTLYLSLLNCKQRTFFDPRTWFDCVEELQEAKTASLTIEPTSDTPNSSWTKQAQQNTLGLLHREDSKVTLSLGYRAFTSFQTTQVHNFSAYSTTKNYDISIKVPQKQSSTLSWIFSKPVQVSQWHGNTVYQKPHGGIDFTVVKESIYTPAEGEIIAAAYDQKNSCNSGGNYIGIKHDSGIYTYYFHLDTLQNATTGKTLASGQKLQAGTRFVTSGNSGMYNCLPLAYHLHFEVRTSQVPSTHTNPVPYMNVDWTQISTANAKAIPGRLSGDNPHPNF